MPCASTSWKITSGCAASPPLPAWFPNRRFELQEKKETDLKYSASLWPRRGWLRTALVLAGALAAPLAFAQDYPPKPIRLVVGFGTGSTTDTLARLVAQKMGDALGQTIV